MHFCPCCIYQSVHMQGRQCGTKFKSHLIVNNQQEKKNISYFDLIKGFDLPKVLIWYEFHTLWTQKDSLLAAKIGEKENIQIHIYTYIYDKGKNVWDGKWYRKLYEKMV